MSQTFPLKKLLELAEVRTDTAASNLGTLMQQQNRQEAKLTLLLKYREEYRQRLDDARKRGLDGLSLRNFHDFLDKLERAISEQQTTVAHAGRAVERGRDEYRALERRSSGYATLSRRFDSTQREKSARAEQKQQDDHAARVSTRTTRGCH